MSDDKLYFVASGIMNVSVVDERDEILDSINNIQKFAHTYKIPNEDHPVISLSDKDAKNIQIVCRNMKVKDDVKYFPGYLIEE